MIVIDAISAVVKGIASPVTEWVKHRGEIKKLEREGEIKLKTLSIEKQAEAISKQEDNVQAWELASIKNSGWKDEYLTLVLTLPAILCFIPGMAEIVAAGFKALQQTPTWYQVCLLVAVGSAFGVKVFTNFKAALKG